MSWRHFMQQHDMATEGVKALPAIGYLGATFGGMSLPDWAALLAIIYTSVLLAQMLVRGCYAFKRWRSNRRAINMHNKRKARSEH